MRHRYLIVALSAFLTASAILPTTPGLAQTLYGGAKPAVNDEKPTKPQQVKPQPKGPKPNSTPWSMLTPAIPWAAPKAAPPLIPAASMFAAAPLFTVPIEKLKEFGAHLGRACGVDVDVLSGNKAALLSGNSPKLLSGNKPKILSDNTTPIMSGNTFSLFSNIKIEITINNSGNNNTAPGGAKAVSPCAPTIAPTTTYAGPSNYAPSFPLQPKSENAPR